MERDESKGYSCMTAGEGGMGGLLQFALKEVFLNSLINNAAALCVVVFCDAHKAY